MPISKTLKYIILAALLVALVTPKLQEYIGIDKFLDAGGSWDKLRFDCKR